MEDTKGESYHRGMTIEILGKVGRVGWRRDRYVYLDEPILPFIIPPTHPCILKIGYAREAKQASVRSSESESVRTLAAQKPDS
jgi:hypothetical protein